MKRNAFFLAIMMAFAAMSTSCKKDGNIQPAISAVDQLNEEVLTVKSIQYKGVDITQYVVRSNNSGAATWEIRISEDEKISWLKRPDANIWEMEQARIYKTSSGKLSINFNDDNYNYIGSYNSLSNPLREFLDDDIFTMRDYPDVECSSECLNGIYQVEKRDIYFVLTREDGDMEIMLYLTD